MWDPERERGDSTVIKCTLTVPTNKGFTVTPNRCRTLDKCKQKKENRIHLKSTELNKSADKNLLRTGSDFAMIQDPIK